MAIVSTEFDETRNQIGSLGRYSITKSSELFVFWFSDEIGDAQSFSRLKKAQQSIGDIWASLV